MSETARVSAFADQESAELRQLIHDLRTPLSIISMGVEALKNARHDDALFAELSQMIVNEGIKPLNEMLNKLGQNTQSNSLP